MSYQKERDEFLQIIQSEGMDYQTATKLLRYSQTLHRLAVAQCNGDYPYNGDRDRPNAKSLPCAYCDGHGKLETTGAECQECKGAGKKWFRDVDADKRHDRRYVVCPKCEASGVSIHSLRWSTEFEHTDVCTTSGKMQHTRVKVCPDCRTTELVHAALAKASVEYWKSKASVEYWKSKDLATHNLDMTPRTDYPFKAVLAGDPRGCVFKVQVPSGKTNDWGKEGICVPVRER